MLHRPASQQAGPEAEPEHEPLKRAEGQHHHAHRADTILPLSLKSEVFIPVSSSRGALSPERSALFSTRGEDPMEKGPWNLLTYVILSF